LDHSLIVLKKKKKKEEFSSLFRICVREEMGTRLRKNNRNLHLFGPPRRGEKGEEPFSIRIGKKDKAG